MTGSHGSASSTKRGAKRSKVVGSTWRLLVGLAFVILSHPARAQLVDVPATWGGDILSRSRLTGDWGGLRDDLAQKGIVLDVDLLLTPQIVISGGRNTGGDFWGNMDYTLNVDTRSWDFGRAVSSRSRPIPASAAMRSRTPARSCR